MSVFKKIFLLWLAYLFVLPVFGETDTDSINTIDLEKYRTGFSVGINDLPWDATGVSLRWWRKSGNGRELIINRTGIYINYSKGERTEEDSLGTETEQTRSKRINIPNITYCFLSRKPLGVKGMYLVKGIGLGAGFGISYNDIYPPEGEDAREYRYYSGNTTLSFPIGIEHFFLEKFPNISYSLSADIYGTLSFNYSKDIREYPDSYPIRSRTIADWYITPSFGISPAFYLRVYF